jgi:hypothetical protein
MLTSALERVNQAKWGTFSRVIVSNRKGMLPSARQSDC